MLIKGLELGGKNNQKNEIISFYELLAQILALLCSDFAYTLVEFMLSPSSASTISMRLFEIMH